MITVKRFRRIERAVMDAGFADIISWSEAIVAPTTAESFAWEAIYVICNSGMRNSVATPVFRRCMAALAERVPVASVFKHPGKAPAIEEIWARQVELFEAFQAADDKVEFCAGLPFIGPVTSHHLAKNFGVDTAKPDVHLERLARREGKSTAQLCKRLSRQTGYRVATVDSILWRACAEGILNSRVYSELGWRQAFNRVPTYIPVDGAEELTV